MSTDSNYTAGYAQAQFLDEVVETPSPYLESTTKKGHKYIHVSKPSLQKQAMFGIHASTIVNAKGTLCKKCQDKKRISK